LKLINHDTIEDFFSLEVFVNKENIQLEKLEKGMRVEGLMWLQGNIVENDKAASPFYQGQSIIILSPTGGEEWPYGSTQEIRWSLLHNVPDSYKISFSLKDLTTGKTLLLDSAQANKGKHNLKVPLSLSENNLHPIQYLKLDLLDDKQTIIATKTTYFFVYVI
jgi:hypothetical protein